jgi:LPS export ABC transporter permease LptF
MRIRWYILSRLLEAFIATMAVLFGVMLIVQWMRIGRAVTLRDVDILLLTFVPMSSFVIPMALIFSILIVLERFSVESEIIAMKSCGVHSATIFTPILFLASFCLLVHVAVSTHLGPLTMKKIQTDLAREAPKKVLAFLEERDFNDMFKDVVIYVESVNQKEKQLKGIFIESSGKERAVITAENGTIDAQAGPITMRLHQGTVFMVTPRADRLLSFDEYAFTLEADLAGELRIKGYDTATQSEFRRLMEKDRTPKRVKEYHSRYAFPMFNLILGLVGISFGIQRPRSPRHTGFIIGIATILGYYLVFVLADRLVKSGVMDPVLGAWAPNIAFGAVLSLVWLRRAFARGDRG